MTVIARYCLNQNWCSLIISASRYIEPEPAGPFNAPVTTALFPGARSAASGKAWLVSQYACLADPPVRLVKCRSRSTRFVPLDGQVVFPLLVTVTGKV